MESAMETSSGENWRREAGDRLRRLHSLVFGAELALERGDANAARTLSLRLIGFLDSQTGDGSDDAFVKPIRYEAGVRLAKASGLLASDSDREAFEQAKREAGCVFMNKGNANIEKIKNSKYFQAFLRHSKGNSQNHSVQDESTLRHHKQNYTNKTEPLERDNEKLSSKISSNMTQIKLTSIYGNKPLKPNTVSHKPFIANAPSGNCNEYMDIDTDNKSIQNGQTGQRTNHHHHQAPPKTPVATTTDLEDEDRPNGSNGSNGLTGLRPKRRQAEFTSPICERTNSPSSNDEAEAGPAGCGFVTAKAKLAMDNKQKYGGRAPPPVSPSNEYNYNNNNNNNNYNNSNNNCGRYNSNNYGYKPNNNTGGGINRRGPRGNFVPPIRNNNNNNGNGGGGARASGKGNNDGLEDSTRKCMELLCGPDGEIPDKLKNIEPRLIEHISNEIMEKDPNVRWSDIAGLEHAKKCVMEMVIYPLIRPDIFKGCRSPGRGLLLFGPPGTGKTMIGKAIAGEAKATFFYISSSSLTSKWIGEGEKLVRALFGVASCRQPAVIFVDEIDSLLSQRKSDGEHESSRRLKTQFLIEMEGFDSGNDQILLIGATNRPQELDEAARRRLSRRLYIPLPSSEARACIIRSLLEKDGLLKLSQEDISTICKLTEGYSGSDMKNLVKDATMGPLREALIQGIEITQLKKEDLRPVNLKDFEDSIQEIRPSVASGELGSYEKWNKQYGSSKN